MALTITNFKVSKFPLTTDEINNAPTEPAAITENPEFFRLNQAGVFYYEFTLDSNTDQFINFNSLFFAFSGSSPNLLMAPLSRSNGFLIDIVEGNTNFREMTYFGSTLKNNFRAFFGWDSPRAAYIRFFFLQGGNEDGWNSGFGSFSDAVKKEAYYSPEMFQASEIPYEGSTPLRNGQKWAHFSIYNNFSPFTVPIETLTQPLHNQGVYVDYFGKIRNESDNCVIKNIKIFEINNNAAEKIGEQEYVLKPIPSLLHQENYRYIGSTNGINPFVPQIVRIEIPSLTDIPNGDGAFAIIYNDRDINSAKSLQALEYESRLINLDAALVDDPISFASAYGFPDNGQKIQELYYKDNFIYFWLDGRLLTRGERYRIGLILRGNDTVNFRNLVDVSLPINANISPRVLTHCTPYMGNYDLELGTIRASAAKHDLVYTRMVINKTQFDAVIRGYGFNQTFDGSSVFVSMDAMDPNYQGANPEFEGALYNIGSYTNSLTTKIIDTPTFKISNQDQTLEVLAARRIDENYPLDNSAAANLKRFYFVRFRFSWVLDGQQINQYHFFELRAHEFRKGQPYFGNPTPPADSLSAISFFQGDTYPSPKIPLRIQCRDQQPILNPVSEVESFDVPTSVIGDVFTYSAAIYAGQQTPLPITDTLLEEQGALKRGYLAKNDYTYFNALTNPLSVTGLGTHRITLASFFQNAWETVLKRKVGKFYHLLTGANQEIPVKIKIGEYRATVPELFFDVAPELDVFLGNYFTTPLLLEQGIMIDLVTNIYNAFGSGLTYNYPMTTNQPFYWMAQYDCDGVSVFILVGIMPSLTDYDIFIEPRLIQYYPGDCGIF